MKIDSDFNDIDAIGNDHMGSSSDTPLREDAFKLSNEEKIDVIKDDVRHILETLGLDLNDDSLKGTPNRVAKMFGRASGPRRPARYRPRRLGRLPDAHHRGLRQRQVRDRRP